MTRGLYLAVAVLAARSARGWQQHHPAGSWHHHPTAAGSQARPSAAPLARASTRLGARQHDDDDDVDHAAASPPERDGVAWRRLPDVERRSALSVVMGAFTPAWGKWGVQRASAATASDPFDPRARTATTIDSWPKIPVWPSWAGGRVIPMSLSPQRADPFLLVAHHKVL